MIIKKVNINFNNNNVQYYYTKDFFFFTVHTKSVNNNKLWSLVTGICDTTLAGAVGHGSSAYSHEFFKRFPELRIEYRVDHRIDKAVHVAQPCGQDEHSDAGRTVLVQFGADRVQDVAREKWYPTEQKHS